MCPHRSGRTHKLVRIFRKNQRTTKTAKDCWNSIPVHSEFYTKRALTEREACSKINNFESDWNLQLPTRTSQKPSGVKQDKDDHFHTQ